MNYDHFMRLFPKKPAQYYKNLEIKALVDYINIQPEEQYEEFDL